ncbi:MAG: metallophosphoesterase family protein [Planctomycetes bacterium]|nr:metallophosphoesterase family protein [Planctomycetota bacterium]
MIAGLEVGGRGALHLREERVTSSASSGPSNGGASRAAAADGSAWTLLFASDLHLGKRRGARGAVLLEALLERAQAAAPDVILLGGDLVDARAGNAMLEECVARLAAVAPVAAVAGNHDVAAGLAEVRAAVRAGGGRWLHDAALTLTRAGRRPLRCTAVGHVRAEAETETETKADTETDVDVDAASEMGRAADAGALHAIVGHHPAATARAAARHRVDVAFAGHLHGGQCVLWQRGTLLYPGALFSRWNGLRFAIGAATLLVSRGVADTLPLRFHCPREVVRCRLT